VLGKASFGKILIGNVWLRELRDADAYGSFIGEYIYIYSFISNLSYDRSTASSKTIPPLNVI
jgi:hypothetical protein